MSLGPVVWAVTVHTSPSGEIGKAEVLIDVLAQKCERPHDLLKVRLQLVVTLAPFLRIVC